MAPNLLESSSVVGRTRVETCRINTNATVDSVDNSCDWILSASNPSVGRYRLTLVPGTFSQIIACFVSPFHSAGLGSVENLTANSFDFIVRYFPNSDFTNNGAYILCVGAR